MARNNFVLAVCVAALGTSLAGACAHDWSTFEECMPPALPDPRAKVVWVAPESTGDTVSDGSLEHPVRTVERAVALLGGGGGTIFMKDGTYPAQSIGAAKGTPDSKIRIRPAEHATVKVIGGLRFASAEHLIVDGLEIFGGGPDAGPIADSGITVAARVTDLTVRDCTFSGLGLTAIDAAGAGLNYERNFVDEVTGDVHHPCLGVPDPRVQDELAEDVVIRNNTITGCQATGIGVRNSVGVTVKDNDVQSSADGVNIENCKSTAGPLLVQRNLIRSGGTGILLEVTSAFPLHDLLIENNLLLGKVLLWRDGTLPNTYDNVILRHNTIISEKEALTFSGTLGPMASKCEATNNVFLEAAKSEIGNQDLGGWSFHHNLWSSSASGVTVERPAFARASDDSRDLVSWGSLAADELPSHADEAGPGTATPLDIDFFCRPRDTVNPTRGAIEAMR